MKDDFNLVKNAFWREASGPASWLWVSEKEDGDFL